jgi:hypothetical protein
MRDGDGMKIISIRGMSRFSHLNRLCLVVFCTVVCANAYAAPLKPTWSFHTETGVASFNRAEHLGYLRSPGPRATVHQSAYIHSPLPPHAVKRIRHLLAGRTVTVRNSSASAGSGGIRRQGRANALNSFLIQPALTLLSVQIVSQQA